MPSHGTSPRLAANRRDYQRHRAARLAKQRRRRESGQHNADQRRQRASKTAIAAEYKDVPCADCGHRYPPYVMDFDHVRGEKVAGVSQLIGAGYSLERVIEEIEKCDVVCSNCHRERTHQRKT